MEVFVLNKKEDKILDRTIIEFKIDNNGKPTPARKEIVDAISASIKSPKDLIVIESTRTTYGKNEIKGTVHVYNDKKVMTKLERSHVLIKNGIIEKTEKTKESGKKEVTKKA